MALMVLTEEGRKKNTRDRKEGELFHTEEEEILAQYCISWKRI